MYIILCLTNKYWIQAIVFVYSYEIEKYINFCSTSCIRYYIYCFLNDNKIIIVGLKLTIYERGLLFRIELVVI